MRIKILLGILAVLLLVVSAFQIGVWRERNLTNRHGSPEQLIPFLAKEETIVNYRFVSLDGEGEPTVAMNKIFSINNSVLNSLPVVVTPVSSDNVLGF